MSHTILGTVSQEEAVTCSPRVYGQWENQKGKPDGDITVLWNVSVGAMTVLWSL